VVDPRQDVEPYLEAAAQAGLRITHIIETHVHADHLSGASRLARVTGAPVLVHAAAPVEFPHVDLADEDGHELGSVRLQVLHTPGHTPDSVALVVTDVSRGPEPWFALTGDTLFAGGVGRPDLFGVEDGRVLAAELYRSLHERLLALPDHVEIYPAHFAGAACGKGLSGKPVSTIGFERRFNPALQARDPTTFAALVLADLPPAPAEFAEIRRRNLRGA